MIIARSATILYYLFYFSYFTFLPALTLSGRAFKSLVSVCRHPQNNKETALTVSYLSRSIKKRVRMVRLCSKVRNAHGV